MVFTPFLNEPLKISNQGEVGFSIGSVKPFDTFLRPVFQARSPLDPRQHHDSRLIQQRAGQRVATPRNPAAAVDLA